MKKSLLTILCTLMSLMSWAQNRADGTAEPYAVLTDNQDIISQDSTGVTYGKTLTFYYDDQKAARNGMSVGPFDSVNDVPWQTDGSIITEVRFNDSFALYRPTSTAYWFKRLRKLVKITGLENLKTENVTNMCQMFSSLKSLASLDLSGLNTSNVTDMSGMFASSTGLSSLNLNGFNTSNVTNMSQMFCELKGAQISLDLSSFDTSKVTDMSEMFVESDSLMSLDLSSFNTSNVTNMESMFADCSGLTSLDISSFNTSNVTIMEDMFRGCSILTTIYAGSGWSTAAVTAGGNMFRNCTSLVGGAGTTYSADHTDYTYAHIDGGENNPGYFTEKNASYNEAYGVLTDNNTVLTLYYDGNKSAFPDAIGLDEMMQNQEWMQNRGNILTVNFDASFANCRPTSTAYWFYGCSELMSITGIEYLVTDNVTSMSGMFMGCRVLDNINVSRFNTEKVTDMSAMFESCGALRSIDVSHFNTANVTNMGNMFANCVDLTSLDVTNFNTANVTNLFSTFTGCTGLITLDLSSFNTAKVTDMGKTFLNCSSLTTIYAGSEWSTASVTEGSDPFAGCTNLAGGAGTLYNENHVDYTYAHIDGGENNPGYFTEKNASSSVVAPEFRFEGDYLTMTTETQNASIFYNMAELTSMDEAVVEEVRNSLVVTADAIHSTYYEQPFELKKNAVVKAIAVMDGPSGMVVSDTTTMVYDYEAWVNLKAAVESGTELYGRAQGNPNVDTQLLEQLQWALNEGDMIYNNRAQMDSYEATHFTQRINELCAQIEAQIRHDGDVLVATVDGIAWTYKIISEVNKTCQIGEGERDKPAIADSISGIVSVPAELDGYTVTTIGAWALYDRKNLTGVNLPATVTNIGRYGMDRSISLLTISKNNPVLSDRNANIVVIDSTNTVIFGCNGSTIPEGIVAIGEDAFRECSFPSVPQLPTSLRSVGTRAFFNCSGMMGLILPEGLESIDTQGFGSCGLQSISFPSTLTSLGSAAFDDNNFTSVYIPATLTWISSSPFEHNSNLTEIIVDAANPNYDSRDNCNAIIRGTTLLQGCNTTIIPNGITRLGWSAFQGMKHGLKTLVIPEGVTDLGDYTFYSCEAMEEVTIPSTVVTIGAVTFEDCISLRDIYCYIQNPFDLDMTWSGPFGTNEYGDRIYENANLHVPYGTKALYEAREGWKKFQHIVEMDIATSFVDGVLTVEGSYTLAEALEQFSGSNVTDSVTVIIWHSSANLTNGDLQSIANPNLLIYVTDETKAPVDRDNVVINGFAKNIVLTDVAQGNNNFYCPQSFTAEAISYTREFKQKTQIGVSRGWETIALPFNVQTIMHETRGLITPFGNNRSNTHFWLRRLTHDGLQSDSIIEANTAYLISMPNSEEYIAEYNLAGRVTFSAANVTVPVTEIIMDESANYMMAPVFQRLAAQNNLYVLNVGEERNGYPEGSIFESNYRAVLPFQAYTEHKGSNPAPPYFIIGDLGGDTTGIDATLVNSERVNSEAWYTLDGRKLQGKPAQKGVYISNGKKVIIK